MPGKRDRGSTTKAEEAFTAIRRQIERGQLPGGAKLTLQSLSDEMQMSLTPIREALRMLQAHGLVEYRPHHGHVVTRYSIPRAEEIYLLRETLEPLATRLAAQRASERELEEIRGLHGEFRAAAEKEDGEQGVIVDLNALWHRAVYEAAHSGVPRRLHRPALDGRAVPGDLVHPPPPPLGAGPLCGHRGAARARGRRSGLGDAQPHRTGQEGHDRAPARHRCSRNVRP